MSYLSVYSDMCVRTPAQNIPPHGTGFFAWKQLSELQ